LKAPEIKSLNLKYGKLLSSFAFNFNLRRYNQAAQAGAYIGPLPTSTWAFSVPYITP